MISEYLGFDSDYIILGLAAFCVILFILTVEMCIRDRPEDVQHEMYRTLPGLEHVKIVRNAYAIEYDLSLIHIF